MRPNEPDKDGLEFVIDTDNQSKLIATNVEHYAPALENAGVTIFGLHVSGRQPFRILGFGKPRCKLLLCACIRFPVDLQCVAAKYPHLLSVVLFAGSIAKFPLWELCAVVPLWSGGKTRTLTILQAASAFSI